MLLISGILLQLAAGIDLGRRYGEQVEMIVHALAVIRTAFPFPHVIIGSEQSEPDQVLTPHVLL